MTDEAATLASTAVHARCTVCRHPDRARIELAMARGMGKRETGKRFGVSADATFRHWQNHVPAAVRAVRKAEVLKPGARLRELVEEGSEGVLDNLKIIQAVLFNQLDQANEWNDGKTAAAIAGRLIEISEIIAKLTGELRQGHGTTVNLLLAPGYADLRLRLAQALRPYPQALQAVVAVFRETEAAHAPQAALPAPVIQR